MKADLDRRSNPRYPQAVSLRYASYQDDETTRTAIGAAETIDVSGGGIQLKVSEPVKVPAYVQVALRLGNATAPIVLLGKTVWCRPDPEGDHRAGIQFLGHVDPLYMEFVEGLED